MSTRIPTKGPTAHHTESAEHPKRTETSPSAASTHALKIKSPPTAASAKALAANQAPPKQYAHLYSTAANASGGPIGPSVFAAPTDKSAAGISITNAKLSAESHNSQLISAGPKAYSYAPTVMRDSDGTYKMWFGGLAPSGSGDAIYFSQSKSPNSGWSKPTVALSAGSSKSFDSIDVCDPSVIRDKDGKYYMYFGGAPKNQPAGTAQTAIGLATSTDGKTWSVVKDSAGKDLAIVKPAVYQSATYGAGQPVAEYKNGYFNMTYTDTTRGSGDQLYMIRSKSPLFASGVQSFDPKTGTWAAQTDPTKRTALYAGADSDMATNGSNFVASSGSIKTGTLYLSTFAQRGKAPVTSAQVAGIPFANDTSLIKTPSGALNIRDNNKIDVMATVNDPSKMGNAPGPSRWSLRNFTIQL
jgi:beta-xylosidase